MTHYDEFGVAPGATADEIHRAHRSLARLLHPDHIQDEELRRLAEEQLKRLNAAYHVLIEPERRRQYDQQLLGLRQPPVFPPPHPTPFQGARAAAGPSWAAACALAFLCFGAGYQTAVVWPAIDRAPRTATPVQAVMAAERPASAPSMPPASPVAPVPAEWKQALDENRELRRALRQALADRDQPSARPAPPAVPPSPTAPAAVAPAATAAPPPPQPAPSGASAVERPAPPAPVRWTGTWIYSLPHGTRAAPGDQYPAEYIELVLMEREESLWGRYRGRYKVQDRALDPEIEFFFEGGVRTAASGSAPARFSWRGSGGAKGEVALRLLSDRTLSIEWFTSQLGRTLTLGSGTAVLVRREDR